MTAPLDVRVLVIGLGGLGSPVAGILAQSGVAAMTLVDDDRVEESNLHRQTLYHPGDAGQLKVQVAARALTLAASNAGHRLSVTTVPERALPDSALSLVAGHNLVVEGGDNFATKFMMADAAHIAGVPIVSAGAVRWSGWALGVLPDRGPCLRCVFEDIPRGRPETCAAAGVIGPVVGAVGALQAALALNILQGNTAAAGRLLHYQGLRGQLRSMNPAPRASCPLCAGEITTMEMARYAPPECAA